MKTKNTTVVLPKNKKKKPCSWFWYSELLRGSWSMGLKFNGRKLIVSQTEQELSFFPQSILHNNHHKDQSIEMCTIRKFVTICRILLLSSDKLQNKILMWTLKQMVWWENFMESCRKSLGNLHFWPRFLLLFQLGISAAHLINFIQLIGPKFYTKLPFKRIAT